jgi:hypothetical protein
VIIKNIFKVKNQLKKRGIIWLIGFVLLIGFIGIIGLVRQQSAQADWFDEGWHYRQKLTINNASSSENLTNFPMLVSLNSSRVDYANTQDAGQDLRFTDPNGVILKYEIEKWNESGTSSVWVKIPQIDAQSTIDYVYMYYGNPSASSGQVPSDVWDSNFKMVQHLEENATSSGAYLDSTSNANNGTPYSTTTITNLYTASGKVNGADSFDGVDDYVNVGSSSSLSPTSAVTISAWVNPAEIRDSRIVAKELAYYLYTMPDNALRMYICTGGSCSSYAYAITNDTIPTSSWTHVVGIYNGSNNLLYINGALATLSTSTAGTGSIDTNANNLLIGKVADNTRFFKGTIDEVRVSNTARSAEWIEAEYKTMTDTYLTYGTKENSPGVNLLWRLDEGTGTTALDESNYSNNGTITNGTWITGKYGKGLTFNGTSTKIVAADSASLDMGTQDWSIGTWIKTNSSATSTIITKGKASTTYSASWYDSSWSYRKQITATSSATAIPSAQTNFPMLVNLTSDADLASRAQSNGNDILFTSSSGTKLDHEIEYYASSTGQLVAWVEVPTLATSTVLYMYYGNPSASSQQNATGTWDGNYVLVAHGDGTSTTITDKTSNAHNGTKRVSNGPAESSTAKIYRSQLFASASSDYVYFDTALGKPTTFTISAWIKPVSWVSGAIVYGGPTGAELAHSWGILAYTGGNMRVIASDGSGFSYFDVEAWNSTNYSSSTFTYITAVSQGAAGNLLFYRDGVSKGTPVASRDQAGTVYGSAWGRRGENVTEAYWYNGYIEEVHVSNTARSANWITTSYYSQNSPSSFYTLGSEEQQGYKLELLANGTARATIASATTTYTVSSSNTINDNVWHHVETTFDRDGNMTIYVDGKDRGSTSISGISSADISNSASLYAGVDYTGAANYFSGSLDDIRIYNYARSPAEVRLDYNAELAADLPIQFGASAPTQGWGYASWSYRKKITIDYTKVATSSQTNFPVLISTTDTSWKNTTNGGHVGQADGGDILFTLSDGVTKLSHEIESYASSTGALVAWVKIPTLSATANTEIYMYYGNASCADQWDPTNVWDSNFKMVQHLKDGADTSHVSDSTTNAYTGTKTGANEPIASSTAKIYQAQYFDNSNDRINIGDISQNNLTLEAWIKTPSIPTNQEPIINKGYTSHADPWYEYSLFVSPTTGYLNGEVTVGGTIYVLSGTGNVADNNWHYVVMRYNGETLSVSNDAGTEAQDTNPSGNVNDYATNTYIGGYTNLSSTGDSYYFNGYIDEVRISNTARDTTWIKTSYNNQNSPSTFYSIGTEQDVSHTLGRPIAYWRFDENAGTKTYDDTTNNNDLIASGASWTTSGKFGNGLSFDGINDQATTSNSTSLNITSDLSISTWVKATNFATTTSQWLVYKDSGSAGYAFGFASTTNKLVLRVDGANYESSATYSLASSTWHHLGATLSGTSTVFYVDGQVLGSTVNAANAPPADASSTILRIGSNNTTYFSGTLDEVKIYNYARTAGEMRTDYNQGSAVSLGKVSSDKYAGWYNTNWKYRKSHAIEGTTAGAQTNYQMQLTVQYGAGTDATSTVYCNSKCNTDFSDIRFTSSNGTTLLDYWIENSTTSVSANVWVEVPLIPASPGGTMTYMYYGNNEATSASNGTNTFLVYDNFSDSDMSDWTMLGVLVDGCTTTSGYAQSIDVATGTPSPSAKVTGDTSAPITSEMFGFTKNITKENGVGIAAKVDYMAKSDTAASTVTNADVFFYTSAGCYLKGTSYVAGGTTNTGWMSNSEIITTSTISSYTQLKIGFGLSDGWSINWNQQAYFDNIRIRKYVDIAPTHSTWGTEEQGTNPIATWRMDEGQGGTVYDDTVNNNDGVLNGSASSWLYRKSHIIAGTTAGAQTNYQMSLTVNYGAGTDATSTVYCGNKCQNDFDDVRFLASDGITQLDHWRESFTTSTSATFWVEIPSIPASPATTTIYMYYGNSSASSASNGTSTFIVFDDFSGSSGAPDTSKWTVYKQGSTSAVAALDGSGHLTLNGVSGVIASGNAKSVATVTNNFMIELSRSDSNQNYHQLTIGSGDITALDGGDTTWWHTTLHSSYLTWIQDNTSGYLTRMPASGSNVNLSAVDPIDSGSYHTWKLSYFSNGLLQFFMDSTLLASSTDTNWLSDAKNILVSQGTYSTVGLGGLATIDWIRARNYASTEPTHSTWGTEESATPIGDWTTGKYGNAIDFDGTNDYVTVLDSTSTSITGDLTISAWIRPDVVSKEQTILGKWDETTALNDRSYRLWIDASNNLNFSVSATGTTVVTETDTSVTFSASTWYHVESVYDDAGTMKIYINGVLRDTKSSGVPASIDNNISSLYIGAKENTSGSIDTKFDGAIDDVRIYNYARSASQVLVDYNGGFAVRLGQ